MISFILDFLMAVFLLRLVIWVARLFLTSGQDSAGSAGGQGGVGRDEPWGSGPGRGRPSSIDRSSAIDVPFTEIPPEGADPEPPEHDTVDNEHDTDIRSAAGDR